MTTSDRPRKILVLDDEPDVVTYLETLLRDNGYETLSAGDGRAGMEIARREKPDLITLDISMPESTGTRFYRDLKADPELKSVPVIIVTAVTGYGGDPHAYEKFISHRESVPPPEGFMPKPIDKEEFLQAVRKILSPRAP
jgi:CheY-like chemotaxis protein